MNRNRRLPITALLLIISIGNYSRIQGNDNVRAIQFISIFAIGALSAILIRELLNVLRNKKHSEDRSEE